MKYRIPRILSILLSVLVFESMANDGGGLDFGFLAPKEQCGCWYYYLADAKTAGDIIAQGEAAEDAVYMIVNDKKIKVGNWQADYREDHHLITYSNDEYKIDIHSKSVMEGKYSAEYESAIIIQAGSQYSVIESFGQCGC